VWPFHGVVFGGMQRNIARAAEAAEHHRSPAATSRSGDVPADHDRADHDRAGHDPAATAEEAS
jgi:hypothetical protein